MLQPLAGRGRLEGRHGPRGPDLLLGTGAGDGQAPGQGPQARGHHLPGRHLSDLAAESGLDFSSPKGWRCLKISSCSSPAFREVSGGILGRTQIYRGQIGMALLANPPAPHRLTQQRLMLHLRLLRAGGPARRRLVYGLFFLVCRRRRRRDCPTGCDPPFTFGERG